MERQFYALIHLLVLVSILHGCTSRKLEQSVQFKAEDVFLENAAALPTSADGDINLGENDYKCPPTLGIMPHPECDKYYTCYPNEPTYLWLCRKDFLFDLNFMGCNYPDQTDCGNRTRPQTTTSLGTTVTPPPFKCPSDGNFAIPDAGCVNEYYVCVGGKPTLTKCPELSVFDPTSRVCVALGTGGCAGSTSTASTETTTQPTTTSTIKTSTETTTQPTTTSTIKTSTEKTTESTTSTVQEETTTTEKTTRSTSSTSTTAATTTGVFKCPPESGQYPYPGSCIFYYVCQSDGSYIISECQSGLVFNPSTQNCDNPDNVPECKVTKTSP